MYFKHLTCGILALTTLVMAAPTITTKAPTKPKCHDFIIPVHARAPVKPLMNSLLPVDFTNPILLEDFIVSEASSGLAALLGAIGTTYTSGLWNMSARYCEPAVKVPGREHTIQYLQHAITNTKNYWNGLAYPVGVDDPKYSWIDVASSYGYPTLSVDNLGSGNSSHPDPFAVVQMSLQVEIIHQIIAGLRSGKLLGPLKDKYFKNIIYTGHSYGSICGNALASIYPKDVDALVLTGYSGEFINGLGPLAAGLAVPASTVMSRFANLNAGYLAQTYEVGRAQGLYTTLSKGVGGYDPAVAHFDFEHEGTVAVGELATLFYGVTPANDFTGPLMIITGKEDAIVCNEPTGPDCGSGDSSKPAVAGKFFPNSKNFTYYIPEKTGHSANVHYSSPLTFQKAHQFLDAQGF